MDINSTGVQLLAEFVKNETADSRRKVIQFSDGQIAAVKLGTDGGDITVYLIPSLKDLENNYRKYCQEEIDNQNTPLEWPEMLECALYDYKLFSVSMWG